MTTNEQKRQPRMKMLINQRKVNLIVAADQRTERYKMMKKIHENKQDFRQMLLDPQRYPFVTTATASEFIAAVTGYAEDYIKEKVREDFVQDGKTLLMMDLHEEALVIQHIERLEDDKRREEILRADKGSKRRRLARA